MFAVEVGSIVERISKFVRGKDIAFSAVPLNFSFLGLVMVFGGI